MPNPVPVTAHIVLLRSAASLRSSEGGAAAPLPTRLKLLNWGVNLTNKGRFIVNDRTLAVLEDNQAKIKRPTIKGDFAHESARTDVKHPIKFAASSAVPRVVKGEGLFVESVEWTPDGIEHVPTHYSDLSAAPFYEDDGTVIGLHSFAVCDHGEVDNMTVDPAALSADLALLSTTNAKPTPARIPDMDTTPLLIQLLSAQGVVLPATATLDQLTAAVNGLATKPAAPAAGNSEIAILTASVTALSGQVANLTTLSASTEVQRQIDQAAALGKLVTLSAEDLVKLGPDRTKAYLDALPADAVPLSQRTPAQLSAGKSTVPGHDPDYLQGLKDMGVDPATVTA